MKTITKKRIVSKYSILSATGLLVLMFISWLMLSGFLEILLMDYSAPDLPTDLTKSEIRFVLLDQILVWETLISSSISYIVFFFPLFGILPVIGFVKERTTIMNMACHRVASLQKQYWKMIIQYSLIGGLTVSFSMFLYFTLFDYFMYPSIEDIGGYMDIFPTDFYSNHPYLFFVFMAFSIYFFISFSYALLACGISMFTDKEYLIIVIPLLIYYVQNLLGSLTGKLIFNISESVVSYNTLYSTGQIFIPVLPVFFGAVVLNVIGVKKQVTNTVIS